MPCAFSAAARARSRSEGADADGTERLADPNVGSQIRFAIADGRPTGSDGGHVAPQFICGAQIGSGCSLAVLPGARLRGREPGPIALEKLPDGVSCQGSNRNMRDSGFVVT